MVFVLNGVTDSYKALNGVTWGNGDQNGLHGVKRGYRVLHGVRGGYVMAKHIFECFEKGKGKTAKNKYSST